MPNNIPYIIKTTYAIILNIDWGAPRSYAFITLKLPRLNNNASPITVGTDLPLSASDLFGENNKCNASIKINAINPAYAFTKNDEVPFGNSFEDA
ncbi:MAG: hypothetical protein NVS1B13_26490 [Flavisolibacter sp.]